MAISGTICCTTVTKLSDGTTGRLIPLVCFCMCQSLAACTQLLDLDGPREKAGLEKLLLMTAWGCLMHEQGVTIHVPFLCLISPVLSQCCQTSCSSPPPPLSRGGTKHGLLMSGMMGRRQPIRTRVIYHCKGARSTYTGGRITSLYRLKLQKFDKLLQAHSEIL